MLSSVAFLACLVLLPEQEQVKLSVKVDTTDGSSMTGTVQFPARIPVKTEFGDISLEASQIRTATRGTEGKWKIGTSDGNQLVGACSFGAIQLETAGGTLTIKEEALRGFTALSMSPPAAAPTPAPAKMEAAGPIVEGVGYRTPLKDYGNRLPYSPAVLLSSGEAIVLIDNPKDECVFYNVASGNLTRVKVESKPVNMVEKDGKVYVANSGSNSLTVIDPKTMSVTGRILLGVAPRWIAAPQRGSFLYFVTGEADSGVQVLDTKGDRVLGPLRPEKGDTGIVGWHLRFVSVTPDNRYLVTQGGLGNPSCSPDIYVLLGERKYRATWDPEAKWHTDHPGPVMPDVSSGRMYCGYHVYTMDMKRRIGQPPCTLTVPHPTRRVVFGVKKGDYHFGSSGILVILDEEKLTVLKEIPVGFDMENLVPTEDALFAISYSHVYRIPMDRLRCAETERALETPRPTLDLRVDVNAAVQSRAQKLIDDASRALDTRRYDVARKKFEEADAADPFSGAKVGIGMVLVREDKYPEAVAHLENLCAFPFREDAALLTLYNQLGIAFAKTNLVDKAIEAFKQGLQIDSNDAMLLKNLGVAYSNSGKLSEAYLVWSKAIQAAPKDAGIKKMMDEVLGMIRERTIAQCSRCDGEGRFETLIEENSGKRQKLSQKCDDCKGAKKTWKRPCVECQGTGRMGHNIYCEKCFGDGTITEPAAGK